MSYTLPKRLLAERGKLGSCSACRFLSNSLATGQVVMLHAAFYDSYPYANVKGEFLLS